MIWYDEREREREKWGVLIRCIHILCRCLCINTLNYNECNCFWCCQSDDLYHQSFFETFFFGYLVVGLLLLVLRHIALVAMIFVCYKHYGTLTVILIWESFLLTPFSGKLFFFIIFFNLCIYWCWILFSMVAMVWMMVVHWAILVYARLERYSCWNGFRSNAEI